MPDGRSIRFVLPILAAWALLGTAPLGHAQIFSAQQVRTGYTPKAVGIADMDEDGRFDIVDAGPGGARSRSASTATTGRSRRNPPIISAPSCGVSCSST